MVLRGSRESTEKKMGWPSLSCTHYQAFWGVSGNPESEVTKKYIIRSTSEGHQSRPREESGGKRTDRFHSQAFWGVLIKSGQKCYTLCKTVVRRESAKSVELSAKRTRWVSEGTSGWSRGGEIRQKRRKVCTFEGVLGRTLGGKVRIAFTLKRFGGYRGKIMKTCMFFS